MIPVRHNASVQYASSSVYGRVTIGNCCLFSEKDFVDILHHCHMGLYSRSWLGCILDLTRAVDHSWGKAKPGSKCGVLDAICRRANLVQLIFLCVALEDSL